VSRGEGSRPGLARQVTRRETVNPSAPYPVYVPKMPWAWWAQTPAFRRFFARELTSVFVALFSAIMMLFLFAIYRGPQTYAAFLDLLKLPVAVALHSMILIAVLYHAVTWLELASHVQVIRLPKKLVPQRLQGKVVPRQIELAGFFVVWIVASSVVAYFHIWF
jgi:fumarate reductase subunit C